MHFRGNLKVGRPRELCQAGGMRSGSFTFDWLRSAPLLCGIAAHLLNGCLGGQSGGETTSARTEPDGPGACACVAPGTRPVRARITRLEGGCAELTVVDVLEEPLPDEYQPLQAGDRFGGVLQLTCAQSPEVEAGDEVLAVFTRGTQSQNTCPEYLECSTAQCGPPPSATETTIAPECEALHAEDPSVDCKAVPSAPQDEAAAYDQCDSSCLMQTRTACEAHLAEEQLGGTVNVLKWEDERLLFYWAGEQRAETFEQLSSPTCGDRHNDLWQTHSEDPSSQSSDPSAAATRPSVAPPPQCPLPLTEQ